jgi:hypothetical protein
VLETLPKREGDWRYAMPFFYQTRRQKAQAHVEADRIDEAERDRLPLAIHRLYVKDKSNYSEREWIEILKDRPAAPDQATLVIRLRADTIDDLERTPVEDIVGDLLERTRRAYAAMPSLEELMQRHGDRDNRRIYACPRCVEMKWLDAWRDGHPQIAFDQSLTHCWFGG